MGVSIGEPHLFGAERPLFDRALKRARHYLEFGTGGSTLAAVRAGAESVVAVESDPAWAAAVREHPEIAPGIRAGRVRVLHADIGPVGPLGYPRGYPGGAGGGDPGRWPEYVAAAWREVARAGRAPDLVYVDGRFRVACCLSVLAARAGTRGRGPAVMVHDVGEDRPHYAPIFRFFEVLEAARSLRLMRPKPGLSPADVLAEMLAHQMDPR